MQITTIAGNVGKDAVLRRTQSGDAVLGFSVAVDNGKDKHGNRRDSTWFSCSIWGKRAESLETYVRKGTNLALTGRVGVDVYDGRGSLTLNVNELTFQGGGQQSDTSAERSSGYNAPPASDYDEIPF